MVLLGVYGTLKRGHYNYAKHLNPQMPIFRGYVKINFQLYSNGSYPMIVEAPVPHRIYFEIFRIDQDKLHKLDELEEPYGYHRISVNLPKFTESVHMYVYNQPQPPQEFKKLKNGYF